MQYKDQYYPYKELCETGRQNVFTKDIDKNNIETNIYSIINILKDGIETEEVQSMMIHVYFANNVDCRLSIFDYWMNLIFWQCIVEVNHPIWDVHLVWFDDITKGKIKEYIDNIFVNKYRKLIPFRDMNNDIDDVIGMFRQLRPFQMYLANSLSIIEDTLVLMHKYPEFNDTIHFSTKGIPIEDVKDAGMQATRTQAKYIMSDNDDHCLKDSFRTGEAISLKQYKEVAVNIGSKPNGQGGVFEHPVEHSFWNGGLMTPEEIAIESSVGRVAQILQKTNVGESGAFARQLELNNQDTFLNPDPDYVCDTKNFEEITIENETMLNMFDLRYYRENPNGVDKLLNAKTDAHKLLHKKIYFRSPMTCSSAAHGRGICYKCYGDLAYANRDINVGQIAAEGLSSIYTQILLSAKHLLESLVIKMEWSKGFFDYLQIQFNTIMLKDDINYKGFKLIIDEEIKSEEEIDDIEYNYYINGFIIKTPKGEEVRIHTAESDNIYFTPAFYDYIDKLTGRKNIAEDSDDNEFIEIDMAKLSDIEVLFKVVIKNNELSATMDKIKRLIDNKSIINQYDRNTILKEFITTNISGGIKLNSVHFEVLLMNQIRAAEDELMMPDWTIPNEPYQILTLSKALTDNRSIAIRLQSNKINKALNNPQNQFINKPSLNDLFYMEQPQEYLTNDSIISDDYQPESDIDDNIEQPVTFDNPKIQVGRRAKKKKISKTELSS